MVLETIFMVEPHLPERRKVLAGVNFSDFTPNPKEIKIAEINVKLNF